MSKIYICPNCKYEGKRKRYIKGSIITEILLWMFFLFPGIIYSIWRLASRKYGCARCKFENIYEK